MTSPPGTIQMSVAGNDGTVTAVIRFDPATGVIWDSGGSALTVTNTSAKSAQVIVTGPNGPTTISVPTGTTTRTAAQLASVGINTRNDISQFSLGLPPT